MSAARVQASSARTQALLWLAQRASAAVLALCVLVHLATMIHAVRGGLSAAEIFSRTHGNAAWLAFYALFALAVAVHAPIGLRALCREWLGWRGASLDRVLLALALAFVFLGWRAAWAVYA